MDKFHWLYFYINLSHFFTLKWILAYFVVRTANTMNLGDQANSKKRIETAIKEMAEALKNEMPKV